MAPSPTSRAAEAPRPSREPRRTVQRAVLDARQKLTSSSGTRSTFDFELLDDYAKARLTSVVPTLLLVAILSLAAVLWIPATTVVVWASVVGVSNLGVTLISRRFRASHGKKFDPKRWTRTFVTAETVNGLAWATLPVLAISGGGQDIEVIIFAMLLVGIAANAVATRTLPSATLAATFPGTVSVAIMLTLSGGTLNYAMSVVVIGAFFFFLFLTRQLHKSEIVNLEHQWEKDALILELQEARTMSDEARREAEQASIAKSRFLATMSHELRTPLNAIIGFSEVLKSELLGPHGVAQYKEYAGDIHASGQHLLNLINELLDLSRIEAGKYDLTEEAISLIDIADDCRRMLDIRARTKSIDLHFEAPDSLAKIWGDERSVRQVVLNLLSNAIKFTPQSGKIVLSVGRSPDGGQFISVIDNGPGIPEDEIETVLSSFGQGSLAHKTAEQGAGLGLPIVQRIMELHQGRFDLFSKLRFGTEVIATFPRARVMEGMAPVVETRNRLEIYSEAS
ncbi:sensor histidine kinase [Pelagibacterium lacus]|uniref:histidine kinase n=1 Tax=Pelagibacterium lacus TaxID=2282655 RepID=A0A369W6S7_9HYPH|nr:ATP-binding protein [Pelagibacterium lacus]RDE10396.1 sensor histidine kinase [Pelagibacterium lacus]